MNSAFEVGGIFTIEDQASFKLDALARQFDALDVKIESSKELLRTFLPAGMGRRIEGLVGSFGALGDAAKKSAASMVTSMGDAERDIVAIAGRMDAGVASAFAGLPAAARDAAASVKASLGGVFDGIDAGITGGVDVITGNLSRITRGANRSARAVENLRLHLTNLARTDFTALASIPMPAVPAVTGRGARTAEADSAAALPGAGGWGGRRGGGGTGGHGPGGGIHYGRQEVPVPGARISLGGNAGMAAAGVAGYAIYEAAELEKAVALVKATSQLPLGPNVTGDAYGKAVKDVIQSGSSASGFSAKEVAEAVLASERQLQGLDPLTRLNLQKTLLPYAESEAIQKETGLKEAMTAFVEVMHQAGVYDPKKMEALAGQFAFTSMTTKASLDSFARASSYAVPILNKEFGMDPQTGLLLTSAMQTAGITSTKSGTWLRSFFQGAAPDTTAMGPLTKHQQQHNEALRRLGLIDEKGNETWKVTGANGQTDWSASVVEMSKRLNAGVGSIAEKDRPEIYHKAFGTQGSGFAAVFQAQTFVEQLGILADKAAHFKGGDDVLGGLREASTVQLAKDSWRDTQNVLMDLGSIALPSVNAGLRSLDEALKFVRGYFNGDQSAVDVGLKRIAENSKTYDEAAAKFFGTAWTNLETDFEARFVTPAIASFDRLAAALRSVLSLIPGMGGDGISKADQDKVLRQARKGGDPLIPLPGDSAFFGHDSRTKDDRYISPQAGKDLTQGLGMVPNMTGLPLGWNPISYGGAANDNGTLEDAIYRGTLHAFTDFANGTKFGDAGGFGGGSGIINASYEGGDISASSAGARNMRYGPGGHSHGGNYGNLVDGPISRFSAGATFASKAPEVMSRLQADFGLTPEMSAKVLGNLGHESRGFQDFSEKGGGSGIGWAQWTGPRHREFLAWAAANHLDPRSDEANYGMLKHDLKGRYAGAVEYLKRGGSLEGFEQIYEGAGVKAYGSRHAYERAALDAFKHRQVPTAALPPKVPTVLAPPPRATAPAPSQPHGGPSGGHMITAENMPQVEVHLTHMLDGKVLAKSVTRHMASSGRFPTNMGGPNTHGHYVSPGTPITDAA